MAKQYTSREQTEVDFWRDDPSERPGVDSLDNQLDKQGDALIFAQALRRLHLPPAGTPQCLELGGGQGWASCVVKRINPDAIVTASDISEYAIASVPRWERIYNVKLDGHLACKSDDIPFANNSLDLIFCFAAAHHFERHGQSLKEIARVLAPGGIAAYIYEPTTPGLLHSWAHRRVNAKRPDVPEDVIVPSRLSKLAKERGLHCQIDYWPCTLKRSGLAAPYYTMLSLVPFFTSALPCTANFIFRKVVA